LFHRTLLGLALLAGLAPVAGAQPSRSDKALGLETTAIVLGADQFCAEYEFDGERLAELWRLFGITDKDVEARSFREAGRRVAGLYQSAEREERCRKAWELYGASGTAYAGLLRRRR
jgi:hypothetical protein